MSVYSHPQIDVSVNAPEAGTIKEFLVNEEDTVTVGQDLVKLELGGAPSGGAKEAKEEPKEPAPKEQETASQPQGGQEKPQETKPAPPKEEPKPAAPESKPAPTPSKPAKETKEAEPKQPTPGNREERRVCVESTVSYI